MKYNLKYRFSLVYLVLTFGIFSQNENFKKNLIDSMITNIEKHKHLQFVMERNERNEKGFKKGKFFAKVCLDPYKIYIKNEIPKKGSEILYIEGENNNKALVNPNFFPYINVSLSPENSLMFAGGHHCLKDLGFNFFNDCFKLHLERYGDKFFDYIEYNGRYQWDNRSCHKLTINYPDYHKMTYKTKEEESLYDISKKKLINIGKLRDYNPEFETFEKIKENQEVTINTIYSKKTIVFIDAKNFFPIYQMLYDENGLYEKYSYTSLVINKSFSEDEFKSGYKDYDF